MKRMSGFLCLAVGTTACSLQKIPYLTPAHTAAWQVIQGRTVLTDSAQGVVGSLAWESFSESTVSFQMRVENRRGTPWTFDPALCLVDLSPSKAGLPSRQHAYDPERLLDAYDRRIIAKEREMRSAAGWSAAGSFLDLVGTVADISTKSKTPEEARAKQQRQQERDRSMEERRVRSANLEVQHSHLLQTRDNLTHSLLRANTLLESQPVGGLILFRRADHADTWSINCPVRDTVLNFTFSQTMREP